MFVERNGRLERDHLIRFESAEHLRHIIDRIVSPLGRRIDESTPQVDARLPEGHRVNAIIPPLAVDGPLLTIRKFRKMPFTEADLLNYNCLTPDMLAFLKACVAGKLNMLVSGGTGTGKTTTLNVLSSFISDKERIVTIEDAAELRFHETHKHVARLEARPPNVEGEGEVTIRDLVRNALRMRPDRIIVGEVRGGEALDMLQAMNTGHEGSMTTVHANSTKDAFSRLENMVMMADSAKQLPLEPIRQQLANAIHIVVQQNRLPDGQRKIVSISEVMGMRKGQLVLKHIFVYNQTSTDENNRVQGYFSPTGATPNCIAQLRDTLPKEMSAALEGIFTLDYFVEELGSKLMEDPSVSEIMINSPEEIYVERRGKMSKLSAEEIAQFGGAGIRHEQHITHIVQAIAARLGRRIDDDQPLLDARLPDGSRINAVLPPLTLRRAAGPKEQVKVGSPVVTIRRFPKPLAMADLLANDALSAPMAEFLEAVIGAHLNVMISGGTGSGKTTLLNVLSSFIGGTERIVTIEDVAELQLQREHWVRLETRPADEFGEGEVTIRDLLRNSLRMRPNRIVVGECRGAEAFDMLQAMNTGHSGSMTTIHANSPNDSLARLETLARMSPEATGLSGGELRQQITVVDLIVQIARLQDGTRRVVSIAEVTDDVRKGEPPVEIFRYRPFAPDENPTHAGVFEPSGAVPACFEMLKVWGNLTSAEIFNADNHTMVRRLP